MLSQEYANRKWICTNQLLPNQSYGTPGNLFYMCELTTTTTIYEAAHNASLWCRPSSPWYGIFICKHNMHRIFCISCLCSPTYFMCYIDAFAHCICRIYIHISYIQHRFSYTMYMLHICWWSPHISHVIKSQRVRGLNLTPNKLLFDWTLPIFWWRSWCSSLSAFACLAYTCKMGFTSSLQDFLLPKISKL